MFPYDKFTSSKLNLSDTCKIKTKTENSKFEKKSKKKRKEKKSNVSLTYCKHQVKATKTERRK